MMATKIRFTIESLAALQVPEGKASMVVYDTGVQGLACRLGREGAKAMFVQKKVKGKIVRKALGRFEPGISKTIAEFRDQAKVELGKIAGDAEAYIEGIESSKNEGVSIAEAFALAYQEPARHGRPRSALSTIQWDFQVKRFSKWLKKKYPHVKTWADLRERHVEAYRNHVAKPGRAANTIRLALQPVCYTGKKMQRKYKIPSPAANLEFSTGLKKDPVRVFLTDVLNLLDWLREHYPHLEAPAALQGLCGLRALEALRLEWRDVDLEHGWIHVGVREAKNEASRRTIPICKRAIEALKRAHEAIAPQAIETMDRKVCVSRTGIEYYQGAENFGWKECGRELGAAIKEWNPEIPWRGRELRKCLFQESLRRGWYGMEVEQYLGHTVTTVTGKHYIGLIFAISEGEREYLEKTMQDVRRKVTDRINAAVQAHYEKRAAKVVELKAEGGE